MLKCRIIFYNLLLILIFLNFNQLTAGLTDSLETRYLLNKDWRILYHFDKWESNSLIAITDIDFYDENNGLFICKFNGDANRYIQITKDQGKSWDSVYECSYKDEIYEIDLQRGDYTDSLHAFIICSPDKFKDPQTKKYYYIDSSCIMLTRDGFKTWEYRWLDFAEDTKDIIMIDSLRGYALTKTHFLYTNDGWRNYSDISFTDTSVGDVMNRFDITESGKIFIMMQKRGLNYKNQLTEQSTYFVSSIDNGKTWEIFPNDKHFITFMAINDSVIFAVDDSLKTDSHKHYNIFRSINGCKNFQIKFKTPYKIDVFNITLAHWKENIAFYGNLNALTFITTNLGESWESQTTKEGLESDRWFYFKSAEFIGPNKMVAGLVFSEFLIMYDPESNFIDDQKITNFECKVYPNPCIRNSILYTNIIAPHPVESSISIYNMSGETIEKPMNISIPKGGHILTLKLSEKYSPGTYFIVISSNGEVLGREKFIVVE